MSSGAKVTFSLLLVICLLNFFINNDQIKYESLIIIITVYCNKMHQMYKKQRNKIIKTQSNYNIDYVSPWSQQQKVNQINPSQVPTHRKLIVSSFMHQIFRKNKKNTQDRQGLTISQYLKEKESDNLRISTQNVLEVKPQKKKCKTQNSEQKILRMPKFSSKRKSVLKGLNTRQVFARSQSGKKISVIDLNETTSYFEEWETRFIRQREKERAYNNQQNLSFFTHKNFRSLERTDKNLFTVHKYLQTQERNKTSKEKIRKQKQERLKKDQVKELEEKEENDKVKIKKKQHKKDFRYFLKKIK